MKKILVVSDIHGNKELAEKFNNMEGYDLKIYCGDLELPKTELSNFDYIVVGNREVPSYEADDHILIEYEGINIFLTHGHLWESIASKIDFEKLGQAAQENGANLVLHGHDHLKANEDIVEGIKRFNPGSTSLPMDGDKGSYGVVTIDSGKIKKMEHFLL